MTTVIVTGCNSGFGLATARLLAERGDDVIATVLPGDPSGTEAIEQECRRGLPITVVPLDVTDERGSEELIDRVLRDHGRIDGLVNNAGVSMMAAFEDVAVDTVQRMLDINLLGPIRLMQLVLPAMREQRFGRIVNVSSGAGYMPMAWQTTYVATKHALDGLSFGVGAEVRPFGIRVSIVSPGVFETGVGGKLWPPTRDSGVAHYRDTVQQTIDDWNDIVVGRDPVEVAEAIGSCLSAENPPARVFVGRDCQRGAEARRRLDDDEWADFLLNPLFRRPGRSAD